MNVEMYIQGALVWAALAAAYCAPWLIARARDRQRSGGVAVVNVLLGWTVLGWVIALAWACSLQRVSR